MRSFRTASIALFGLLALAPIASARVIIGARFGPVWYGGPAYAYAYPPYAYAYPYGYPYAYPAPVRYGGELKLKDAMRGESIYVDGGYVGLTNKVKSMPLSAGNHDVEMRDPDGRVAYRETVNIIAGRTTEIHPVPNY